ncbi:MAG: type VI secretion system tube protein Hcp [Pseudomonadota bacterium]
MSIYMKVPFAQGDVTATGFIGWIELETLQFQVDRSLSMETSSTSNHPTSLPKFSLFTVTKKIEDSSGGLFEQAVKGMSGHDIEIAVVETGNAPKEYARYTLRDAYLSHYSVDASQAFLAERVSFAYSYIQAEYKPHNRQNTGASKITTMYELNN